MRKYLAYLVGAMLLALVITGCAGAPAAATVEAPVGEVPLEAVQPEATAEIEQAVETTTPNPTAEAVEPATEQVATEESAAGTGPVAFRVVPEESQARFVIQEVLAGADTTVIGATNAVEGQIMADFANPAQSSAGAFRVDLSTLLTDNSFRNRAIREMILQTDNPEFQYAVFEPAALTGLPESVAIGQPFSFQATGDLTIRGTTQPVTFDVTATPVSEARIEGSATLTLPYSTFVTIPRLPPQVASVSENVTLELAFVAVPVE